MKIMPDGTRRHLCIFIVFVYILSGVFLTGCDRSEDNGGTGNVIPADTPWYNCETVTYSEEDVGDFDSSRPIYADPGVQVFYRTSYPDSYESCSLICLVDESGRISNIDLKDYFPDSSRIELYSCFRKGEDFFAVIFNVKDGINHSYIYRFVSDNGELDLYYEFEADDDHSGMYADKVIYKNDKYFVHVCYLDGYQYMNSFFVLDEQFDRVFTVDIDEEFYLWTVNDSDEFLYIGWAQVSPATFEAYVFKVDPYTGTKTRLDIGTDILERYIQGGVLNGGFMYLTNKDLTLTKLDLETGEETRILNYNNSNVNLANIRESELLYCDDNDVIAAKSWYYPSEPMSWRVYSLHRADENPNAGKRIIKAATYFYVNILAANAITQFNESNEDLYIYLSMDYSRETFTDYDRNGTGNDLETGYRRDMALLTTLKNDIRNGTGPDILLDFGRYAALNDPEYLLDLSGMINDPDQINRDDYFSNFFDAYTIDGRLYQIPVSACVAGIYAYEDPDNDARTGFTIDEYKDYVSEYCNGVDPLGDTYGRGMGFQYLFSSYYRDVHDEQGFIQLDNTAFREMCEYFSAFDVEQNPAARPEGGEYVSFTRVHFDLSRRLIQPDKSLFGLPSESGDAGPVALCMESVAITSCADNAEELFGFIRSILSYDVQITNVAYNPINRAAMDHYANDGLIFANNTLAAEYRINDYNGPEMIDEYIGYLSSANTCYMADEYSLLILFEELQPYYAGQKTLDEVIVIAEDRINNMMEENR